MTLRYVYGIVPSTSADQIATAALQGIEGGVRAIVEGELAAATSDVSDSEFGATALNEHVRDLDWLTPRASAHQRVNARLLDIAGTVIPLTFGALYRDDDRVRAMLAEDANGRVRRLGELRGKAEWVVTVTRRSDETPGADEDLQVLDREIGASTPGRAFLLEKQRTKVAQAAGARSDADVAAEVFSALADVAQQTYREPVGEAGADVIVLRLSLLASRDDDRVDARIAGLEDEVAPRGYRLRATGPWPAYRFGSQP